MGQISESLYFDEPGPSNTQEILKQAMKKIEELELSNVVIASDTGSTVKSFLRIAPNKQLNITVITNHRGSMMPVSYLSDKYKDSRAKKEQYMKERIESFPISISDENLREFEKKGIKVHFLPDTLHSIRNKLDPFIPKHLRPLDFEAGADLSLLNILSNGFRVCIGIAVISVKGGFVPEGEIALSIAGSGVAGGGADTALIIRAHSDPRKCCIEKILGFPRAK